jgi:hypothetical protein
MAKSDTSVKRVKIIGQNHLDKNVRQGEKIANNPCRPGLGGRLLSNTPDEIQSPLSIETEKK